MTDEALMIAVRSGDLDCLSALFQRHYRTLYGFLYRMTQERSVAEDLVQEVFARILKYRHTYEDEGTFEAWLYRIARNSYYDFARKHPAHERSDDDFELPTSGRFENRTAACRFAGRSRRGSSSGLLTRRSLWRSRSQAPR